MAGFLAYGLWTLPKPQPSDAEGFSSERVLKDIEVISRDRHSVAQPEERAAVREYLVERLGQLGADTVIRYRYDSLSGPENKHVRYVFDAVDVLAEFAPAVRSDDDSYLMLVAHYDSRYSQPMPEDTVWSFGAADDGYGVGVILETVSCLAKHRDSWKQGLKVLFTDAEEVGMMGMKAIHGQEPDVFGNVGLLLNIEARGPWGPALLFETGEGNSRLLELYKEAAAFPYTYSLTDVVYGFMPNFTDFTVVKDEIPGMNFSTVADINHYHTDLDNFSNVSERSIQHYGSQVLPVAEHYLTSEKYSDRSSLKSEDDSTYFTVPAIGLLKFSKSGYLALNLAVFVLFLLVFALDGVRGRIKAPRVFRAVALVLACALGVLLLGELSAWVCALAVGAEFNIFGIVAGIPFDNIAMASFISVMAVICVLVYVSGRKKAMRKVSGSMRSSAPANAASQYAYNVLYGTAVLVFIAAAVLLTSFGENLMFLIPLSCVSGALALYRLTSLKLWLPVAFGLMLLHAFSFLYVLAMAMTIGAFGLVAMLAFIDIMLLVPMADIYMMGMKRK